MAEQTVLAGVATVIGLKGEPGPQGQTGAAGQPGPAAIAKTHTENLGLIALGNSASFNVNVPGAQVGMVAVVDVANQALLDDLNFLGASVIAPDTVRVRLKPGIALMAGSRTFYIRVIR